jgi:hypothetical protein
MLVVGEVFERLQDPTTDAGRFDRDCRSWAEQVLIPRYRSREGGGK